MALFLLSLFIISRTSETLVIQKVSSLIWVRFHRNSEPREQVVDQGLRYRTCLSVWECKNFSQLGKVVARNEYETVSFRAHQKRPCEVICVSYNGAITLFYFIGPSILVACFLLPALFTHVECRYHLEKMVSFPIKPRCLRFSSSLISPEWLPEKTPWISSKTSVFLGKITWCFTSLPSVLS